MRVNGPFFATSVDRPYVGDLPSLAPAPGHPVLGPRFDTVVQAALTQVAYIIGTSFKPGPRADAAEFTHRDRW